ncbi:short-chain dehydrogenase/reductase [Kaistia sp. 32K]|uniref:SDR family NAD(P)-dependent oxidoreductase n=1 Tax=Kaistia sp. 32K TaxID=2795690 RepID=UPI00191543BC|nr:SDR family NAD(P)-dependent oxidoreductase [Kaistia sp. 32K]BCP53664.1 short-chain dehydrogenase/reductase [Kaistia sp. 32K]
MTTSKVWFITGASRGFGRIWVEAALARGDSVAAAVRKTAALDDLARQYPDTLQVLSLDVTDRDGVARAVAEAAARFGRLDVVLNNAGHGCMGAVEEVAAEDVRATFETNVFGSLWVIQAALPLLREQGFGHILQMSSVAGVVALPTAGIYEGAKFAVEGIVEALAGEVERFGIKVTLIEPAGYATSFLEGPTMKQAPEIAAYNVVREELAERLTADQLGDPRATVPAILKLVDSDKPPLRLILGDLLPLVKDIYADRIRTWESWEDVSKAALRL